MASIADAMPIRTIAAMVQSRVLTRSDRLALKARLIARWRRPVNFILERGRPGACRGAKKGRVPARFRSFPWCFQSRASVAVTGEKYVSEQRSRGTLAGIRHSAPVDRLCRSQPAGFPGHRVGPRRLQTLPVCLSDYGADRIRSSALLASRS